VCRAAKSGLASLHAPVIEKELVAASFQLRDFLRPPFSMLDIHPQGGIAPPCTPCAMGSAHACAAVAARGADTPLTLSAWRWT